MNNKKNLTETEMILCLHAETVHVLHEMTETCFCKKAGIKSRQTLRDFCESGQISSLTMMAKIAKGCGLKLKFSFNRG